MAHADAPAVLARRRQQVIAGLHRSRLRILVAMQGPDPDEPGHDDSVAGGSLWRLLTESLRGLPWLGTVTSLLAPSLLGQGAPATPHPAELGDAQARTGSAGAGAALFQFLSVSR